MTKQNKDAFLSAFIPKAGIIYEVCEAAGIARRTYQVWRKEDQEFHSAICEMEEQLLDLAESKLMAKIKEGNMTAVIFFLKCKGKARGYIERQEVTGADGSPLYPEEEKQRGVEFTKQILEDPVACRLANELLGRVAGDRKDSDCTELPGGAGMVRH